MQEFNKLSKRQFWASKNKMIIDVHTHFISAKFDGIKEVPEVNQLPIEARKKLIQKELFDAKVKYSFCMGRLSKDAADPLGVNEIFELKIPNVYAIGCANPYQCNTSAIEPFLAEKKVVALKAYLGYLPFGATSKEYIPYYKLARKYNIPVVFHTGDTYSSVARIKYAKPLPIDDVAVDFGDVSFVLAHFGYPWLEDAAEIILKNKNVWADLSGLAIGDLSEVDSKYYKNKIGDAISFTDKPERFMYGSDWPLVNMVDYKKFIAKIIDKNILDGIMYDNAASLYKLE